MKPFTRSKETQPQKLVRKVGELGKDEDYINVTPTKELMQAGRRRLGRAAVVGAAATVGLAFGAYNMDRSPSVEHTRDQVENPNRQPEQVFPVGAEPAPIDILQPTSTTTSSQENSNQ